MLPLKRHKRDHHMKKTISALFLLLFILIVTCAYQKSATIYTNSLAEHPTPMDVIETDTLIVIKETANTVVAPVKEKAVAAKTIEKQIEVKTVVQSEKETPKPPISESTREETDTLIVIKESANTVVAPVKEKAVAAKTIEKQTEVKTVVKSAPKLPISESTKEEEAAEKTLLAKLKSAVLKRLQFLDIKIEEETEQSKPVLETQNHQVVKDLLPKVEHNTSEEESKPVALENVSQPAIENISLTVTYNTSEEEIVDHLVEALKQQDLAFKNRDKFLLEIEALIEKALDDRNAAIAHRKKEGLALKKTQKVLLNERDLNTKKIPEPYTINPGE